MIWCRLLLLLLAPLLSLGVIMIEDVNLHDEGVKNGQPVNLSPNFYFSSGQAKFPDVGEDNLASYLFGYDNASTTFPLENLFDGHVQTVSYTYRPDYKTALPWIIIQFDEKVLVTKLRLSLFLSAQEYLHDYPRLSLGHLRVSVDKIHSCYYQSALKDQIDSDVTEAVFMCSDNTGRHVVIQQIADQPILLSHVEIKGYAFQKRSSGGNSQPYQRANVELQPSISQLTITKVDLEQGFQVGNVYFNPVDESTPSFFRLRDCGKKVFFDHPEGKCEQSCKVAVLFDNNEIRVFISTTEIGSMSPLLCDSDGKFSCHTCKAVFRRMISRNIISSVSLQHELNYIDLKGILSTLKPDKSVYEKHVDCVSSEILIADNNYCIMEMTSNSTVLELLKIEEVVLDDFANGIYYHRMVNDFIEQTSLNLDDLAYDSLQYRQEITNKVLNSMTSVRNLRYRRRFYELKTFMRRIKQLEMNLLDAAVKNYKNVVLNYFRKKFVKELNSDLDLDVNQDLNNFTNSPFQPPPIATYQLFSDRIQFNAIDPAIQETPEDEDIVVVRIPIRQIFDEDIIRSADVAPDNVSF